MKITVTDEDYEDVFKIDLNTFNNEMYWKLYFHRTGAEYEGTLYNHRPNDILGAIAKISTSVGEV